MRKLILTISVIFMASIFLFAESCEDGTWGEWDGECESHEGQCFSQFAGNTWVSNPNGEQVTDTDICCKDRYGTYDTGYLKYKEQGGQPYYNGSYLFTKYECSVLSNCKCYDGSYKQPKGWLCYTQCKSNSIREELSINFKKDSDGQVCKISYEEAASILPANFTSREVLYKYDYLNDESLADYKRPQYAAWNLRGKEIAELCYEHKKRGGQGGDCYIEAPKEACLSGSTSCWWRLHCLYLSAGRTIGIVWK